MRTLCIILAALLISMQTALACGMALYIDEDVSTAMLHTEPVTETSMAVLSEEDAISWFKRLFGPALAVRYADDETRREYWQTELKSKQSFWAALQPCEQAYARVQDTLSAAEAEKLIVSGTLEELKAFRGECWTVESAGSMKSEMAGYIDPMSGGLIFSWIVPEG